MQSFAYLQETFSKGVMTGSGTYTVVELVSWQFANFQMEQRLSASRVAELEQAEGRISEQLRQANEALAKSEERFRDLFDEAPIAYVHEGLDSRLIQANRAAMSILGLKPEDIAGTFGKSLVPDTPEAQRRLREALDPIGHGTDASGVVLELRRKDNGKPVWIQWWSRPAKGSYFHTPDPGEPEHVTSCHSRG